MGSVPGFSSLSDETLNRGPMTVFQDKLLTRTDCDEAGDYVVPNVLSPRDLVFRPDIGHKLYHHRKFLWAVYLEGVSLIQAAELAALECLKNPTSL